MTFKELKDIEREKAEREKQKFKEEISEDMKDVFSKIFPKKPKKKPKKRWVLLKWLGILFLFLFMITLILGVFWLFLKLVNSLFLGG